jgi:hypothetical protein
LLESNNSLGQCVLILSVVHIISSAAIHRIHSDILTAMTRSATGMAMVVTLCDRVLSRFLWTSTTHRQHTREHTHHTRPHARTHTPLLAQKSNARSCSARCQRAWQGSRGHTTCRGRHRSHPRRLHRPINAWTGVVDLFSSLSVRLRQPPQLLNTSVRTLLLRYVTSSNRTVASKAFCYVMP